MRYGRAALREGASKSLGGWSGEVAGSGIRQVGTCQITEGLIDAVYQFGLSSEGNGEALTDL